jgi:hypothetical protein
MTFYFYPEVSTHKLAGLKFQKYNLALKLFDYIAGPPKFQSLNSNSKAKLYQEKFLDKRLLHAVMR